MANELLIYGPIYSGSAAEFMRSFSEVDDDSDLVVRVNTEGGSPEYGWGMVAKFIEHTGSKRIKNDGKAYSWGTFFNLYATDCEALDVTEFLFHRAAYPDWFERSEDFTDELRGNLERINASLRKAMEAKLDVELFEQLSGVTLDELFSMDTRKDVFMNAEQAKKIGLISKITKITPERQTFIDTGMARIAAQFTGAKQGLPGQDKKKKEKTRIMTLAELKANHPDLYKEAFDAGVTAERDRVGAAMVYNLIDPEAVGKIIKEGGHITATQREEFNLKAINTTALNKIEADSAEEVKTEEAETKEATKEEKALADFEAEVNAHLKLENK